MPSSAVAVLCPTKSDCQEIGSLIDSTYKPKAMSSRELDIKYPGVKVLTMHAAKGLQFPIVVAARVERDKVPWPVRGGNDLAEHESRMRRLLYVACSRAMRRLLVITRRGAESPFLDNLKSNQWST